MNGIERIAAERQRQRDVEGWTRAHDADHRHGELAMAAACYSLTGRFQWIRRRLWPWNESWWKPTPDNRIRDLEKAGALIAAEIDRLLALDAEKLPPIHKMGDPGYRFAYTPDAEEVQG